MIKRVVWIIITIFILFGTILLYKGFCDTPTQVPNDFAVQVNRQIHEISDQWDAISEERDRQINTKYSYDYAIVNEQGELLQYTATTVSQNESQATNSFDNIRDIEVENQVVGHLFVQNPKHDFVMRKSRELTIWMLSFLFILFVLCLGYVWYLKRSIIQPFQKMEQFASQVALGNLDILFETDRNQIFGAYTQSFDIMREELKEAKKREMKAVQSRKELVAQLSHDIKTPVASLKAMSEVLSLTITDEEAKKTVLLINSKADQIDSLVSNLFYATLEELEQLNV